VLAEDDAANLDAFASELLSNFDPENDEKDRRILYAVTGLKLYNEEPLGSDSEERSATPRVYPQTFRAAYSIGSQDPDSDDDHSQQLILGN